MDDADVGKEDATTNATVVVAAAIYAIDSVDAVVAPTQLALKEDIVGQSQSQSKLSIPLPLPLSLLHRSPHSDGLLPHLSLGDVLNAVPQESQEETMVMSHIERIDPSSEYNNNDDERHSTRSMNTSSWSSEDNNVNGFGATKVRRSSSTLIIDDDKAGSLPLALVESMQEDKMIIKQEQEQEQELLEAQEQQQKQRKQQQQQHYSNRHKNLTTEEELFQLTNDLVPQQQRYNVNGDDYASASARANGNGNGEENENDITIANANASIIQDEDDDDDEESRPLTQTQIFVANAGQIMENLAAVVEEDTNEDSFDLEDQQQGGIEEGDCLSKSLSSPGHANNKKKKKRKKSSSCRTNCTINWQNAQEIRRILHSNVTVIVKYARIAMLYIILPATVTALLLYYVFDNPLFLTQADAQAQAQAQAGEQQEQQQQPNLMTLSQNSDKSTDTASSASEALEGDATNSFVTTTTNTGTLFTTKRPSWSWLIMFFGVRQVITFAIAVGIQFLVIIYYQQPGLQFQIVGPMTRLFLIQARGIPLIFIFWGLLDLLLLHGTHQFANHWMFYSRIELLNDTNPSGFFPANKNYRSVLLLLIGTGVAMAAKRFLIGLRFGQNSYDRYADRLTTVLKEMLQISQLARLSDLKNTLAVKANTGRAESSVLKSIMEDAMEVDLWLQKHLFEASTATTTGNTHATIDEINDDDDDDDDPKDYINSAGVDDNDRFDSKSTVASKKPSQTDNTTSGTVNNPNRSPYNNLNSGSFKVGSIKINEMLGEWEELDAELTGNRKKAISLNAIVQFECSLGALKSNYPFGQYFGYSPTRQDSVECSQRVYSDLVKIQHRVSSFQAKTSPKDAIETDENNPSFTLKFHTIALIAMNDTGELDTDQGKQLIRLFRPTRQGDISLVDFCKSIDTVYKEIRKLRASVANEGIMNNGTERLINTLFYFTLIVLAMIAIGINVMWLFGSISALVISFSFCVGGASSEAIKGLLFILLQRPYDIGDKISIASATDPAVGTGSPQWTVTNLTLYHTTLLHDASLELATLSNGSMANLRIINGARSPRAQLQFRMKFGVGSVTLKMIEEFKERLFAFVRSKPREWVGPCAFRLSTIEADKGYVEYFILLQHRESWQYIGSLKNSLSDVQQFGFELSTSMGMDYRSPALPIHFGHTSMDDLKSSFAAAAVNPASREQQFTSDDNSSNINNVFMGSTGINDSNGLATTGTPAAGFYV